MGGVHAALQGCGHLLRQAQGAAAGAPAQQDGGESRSVRSRQLHVLHPPVSGGWSCGLVCWTERIVGMRLEQGTAGPALDWLPRKASVKRCPKRELGKESGFTAKTTAITVHPLGSGGGMFDPKHVHNVEKDVLQEQ